MAASPSWRHHPDGGNKLQRWKTHQVQSCFALGPRMQEFSDPEQHAAWVGWGEGGVALNVHSFRTDFTPRRIEGVRHWHASPFASQAPESTAREASTLLGWSRLLSRFTPEESGTLQATQAEGSNRHHADCALVRSGGHCGPAPPQRQSHGKQGRAPLCLPRYARNCLQEPVLQQGNDSALLSANMVLPALRQSHAKQRILHSACHGTL